MKNNQTELTYVPGKTLKTVQDPLPRLSDDAFYLIALASLLKKMMQPDSLQEFLMQGNFVKISIQKDS